MTGRLLTQRRGAGGFAPGRVRLTAASNIQPAPQMLSYQFRFAKIHLYFSHFLSHRIYLPSLTSMPCSLFSRFHRICILTILHLSKNEGGFLICHKCHWGFLLFASIWCPTASGCEGVGVSTQTGGGIQIWGVATYRRCTNIPRQEMSCQGALGIERGWGGVIGK